ncbi:34378_t:CDS:2, partial [Gigaspora margarita]
DATTRHPIFSVAEEIVPFTKLSFILCETVEWNYSTLSYNPQASSVTNSQSNHNKHQRLENLECQRDPPNSIISKTLNTELVIDKGKKPSTFNNNINVNGDYTSSSNTIYPLFDNPTTSYNISNPSDSSQ